MLVFKRALSILLSSLIAMPSVVWAKAPSRAPASKKPAVVASKTKRGDIIVPTALPIVFKNNVAYSVSETRGRGNRVKSRTVSGPDYAEFILDNNDDGYADLVQVTRDGVRTTATNPFRGQFRRIDVEKTMSKGVYKAKLLLSFDGKRYEMIEQAVHAFGKFGAEAATPPPPQNQVCLTANNDMFASLSTTPQINFTPASSSAPNCPTPEVIGTLDTLRDAITAAVARSGLTREQVIHCQLDKFQRVLYDKSCFSGLFNSWDDSVHHINAGLARVMASGSPTSSGSRTHLTCLQDNGLGGVAGGMSEKLYDRFKDMSYALIMAGLTPQDIAAKFAEVSPQACQPQTEIRGASGVRVNLLELNTTLNRTDSRPMVTCARPTPGRRAEYSNGTITMYSKKETISRDTPNCNGCSIDDAYASTVFHELVHAAGFNETHETTVLNAEQCCNGLGTSDSRSRSCDALRGTTRTLLRSNRSETLMGSLFPDYNVQAVSVSVGYQPNGSQMLETYHGYLGDVIEQSIPPATLRELSNCQDEACRVDALSRSGVDYKATIEAATREFFTGPNATCRPYEQQSRQRRNPLAASCADTERVFLRMLNTQNTENTLIGRTGGINAYVSGIHQLVFDSPEYSRARTGTGSTIPVAIASVDTLDVRPVTIPTDLVIARPQFGVSSQAITEAERTANPRISTVNTVDAENQSAQVTRNSEPVPGFEPPQPRGAITVEELPPIQQTSTPTTTTASAPTVRTTTTTVAPANTAPSNTATSNTSSSNTRRSLTNLSGVSTRAPTSSASAYTSGVQMPTVTEGANQLQAGVGSPNAGGNRLPITSLVTEAGTAVTSAVARVGQTVVAATTPAARAAEQRMPASNRQEPARQEPSRQAQSNTRTSTQSQLAQASPSTSSDSLTSAGAGLRAQAPISSFPSTAVSSNFTQPLNVAGMPDGLARLAANTGRDRSRGGDARARRDDPSERGGGSAAERNRRVSAGGGRSGAAGDEDSKRSAESDDERTADDGARDGNGVVERGESREVASVETAVAPPRPSAKAKFRAVKGTTELLSYIRRQIGYTEMNSYLVDREFVQKLRAEGVAVRSPNGTRVGAPPPAPLMEPCSTQQRYMLEGTCR